MNVVTVFGGLASLAHPTFVVVRLRAYRSFLIMTESPAVHMHQLMLPYLNIRTKPQEITAELAYEVAAIVIEWGAFENAIAP
jgi:hypothetical protein